MGGIAHGFEVCHRTQHGVGSLVVAGVVAVGGEALGHGIQVENGSAKGCDIVHLLGDALEVAAVEVVIQHQTFGSRPPVHLVVPVAVNGVGFQFAG